MKRLAIAAVLAVLTASAASAQTTPVLRTNALVSSELVLIGDLVDHVAPAKARIPVFRAPDLGETGSVPVAAVLAALRPHDVLGVDTRGMTELSVTRASRAVSASDLRHRIAELVAERLRVADPANIHVALDTPMPTIHLDASNTAPLAPLRGHVDRNGRFDLTFKTDGSNFVRVTGQASEAYESVVVTRPVARGEVLRASDLRIEKRPKSEGQGDAARDLNAAIGMSIQQSLRAGQVVRNNDLAKPQIVKRGEAVVLHYEVPGIVLTARGKAEESGAMGDVVSIMNLQSKRVVQGIVTGNGHVTVTSLAPQIVSATTNRASNQHASAALAARSKAE